ncbi:MAG TPA: DUF2516 family protein [Micromonosporaceae bacterium]|nr:DUF2516 family protein [Micromonosporaceae bacterium]
MFSAAVPVFYGDVIFNINRVLLVFALAIEAFAFVHCLVQRAEAFPAIGTMSKGVWLAMTGGSVLITLVASFLPLLGMVAITIAAVYLLDIRPALRDAVDGHGSW